MHFIQKYYTYIVILLLLVHAAIAITSSLNKSATCDETAHLAGGYSYWKENDYRLQPENGNFPQRWATIPFVHVPWRMSKESTILWEHSAVYFLGQRFLYKSGLNSRVTLFKSRFMIVLLSTVLGLIVFLWSKSLFGISGGIISLCIYCLCPNIIAHSRLVTSDMASTLFFTLSLWTWWFLLQRISVWTIFFSGLSLSLLFLSKMSAAVILFPLTIVTLTKIFFPLPQEIKIKKSVYVTGTIQKVVALSISILIIGVLCWSLVWTAYGNRYDLVNPQNKTLQSLRGGWEEVSENPGFAGSVMLKFRRLKLLPEAYIYGFLYVLKHSQSRVSFLNGNYSLTGSRWFFPYAFLIKMPIPILFIIIACFFLTNRKIFRDLKAKPLPAVVLKVFPTLILTSFIAVYAGLAIMSSLNIGFRHLLPILPPIYILSGSLPAYIKNKSSKKILIPSLLILLSIDSFTIYPHYLAYFNAFIGGPANGYKHLVDSSLDWGQDLPGLKKWIDNHRNSSQDSTSYYLSYFGSDVPEMYGLNVHFLPGFHDKREQNDAIKIKPGIYCISASILQGVYTPFYGEWQSKCERQFQTLLKNINSIEHTFKKDGELHIPHDQVKNYRIIIQKFNDLLITRLMYYLRQKEPIDKIGYSILVYNFSLVEVVKFYSDLSDKQKTS